MDLPSLSDAASMPDSLSKTSTSTKGLWRLLGKSQIERALSFAISQSKTPQLCGECLTMFSDPGNLRALASHPGYIHHSISGLEACIRTGCPLCLLLSVPLPVRNPGQGACSNQMVDRSSQHVYFQADGMYWYRMQDLRDVDEVSRLACVLSSIKSYMYEEGFYFPRTLAAFSLYRVSGIPYIDLPQYLFN